MKKAIIAIALIVLCLSGCTSLDLISEILDDTIVKTTDPAQYGEEVEEAPFPEFFPESIDGYTVNSYSYTVKGGDPRHEIFLDVTLNQEQFDYLLDSIKSLDLSYNETEAYYADGYQEIIFANRTTDDGENPDYIVSMAEIKKVVYNTETLNIVFVDFTIYDAYPLYEIAYFNRFGIEWSSYIEYME